LMSQQFEKAIEFLSTVEAYQVEAVHFAFALYYYGVLRQPIRDLNVNYPTFEFVRFLKQYVNTFCVTNPEDALYYFTFISELDSNNRPLRDLYIKDLMLETREFVRLREKIADIFSRDKAREITLLAATDSENPGRYEDAIRLYELADNYNKVLAILNSHISRLLAARGVDRDRVIALANEFAQHDDILRQIQDKRSIDTFQQMRTLATFFDLYNFHRYEEAILCIESLNILPTNNEEIGKRVDAFHVLDIAVKQKINEIVYATMDILYKIFMNIKSSPVSPYGDGGKEVKLKEIRSRSKAINSFCGRLQFKMNAEVTNALLRLEVFMA